MVVKGHHVRKAAVLGKTYPDLSNSFCMRWNMWEGLDTRLVQVKTECSKILLGDFGHEQPYHCCFLFCSGAIRIINVPNYSRLCIRFVHVEGWYSYFEVVSWSCVKSSFCENWFCENRFYRSWFDVDYKRWIWERNLYIHNHDKHKWQIFLSHSTKFLHLLPLITFSQMLPPLSLFSLSPSSSPDFSS